MVTMRPMLTTNKPARAPTYSRTDRQVCMRFQFIRKTVAKSIEKICMFSAPEHCQVMMTSTLGVTTWSPTVCDPGTTAEAMRAQIGPSVFQFACMKYGPISTNVASSATRKYVGAFRSDRLNFAGPVDGSDAAATSGAGTT